MQLGGRHARGGGVALGDQGEDRRRAQLLDHGGIGRHVARAHDFELRHRQAAAELVEVFAEQDLGQQLFDLAELAFVRDAVGPVGGFLERLDIGQHPGEAVGGALFLIDLLAVDFPAGGDLRGNGLAQCEEISLGVRRRLANCRPEIRNHDAVRHPSALPFRDDPTSSLRRCSKDHVGDPTQARVPDIPAPAARCPPCLDTSAPAKPVRWQTLRQDIACRLAGGETDEARYAQGRAVCVSRRHGDDRHRKCPVRARLYAAQDKLGRAGPAGVLEQLLHHRHAARAGLSEPRDDAGRSRADGREDYYNNRTREDAKPADPNDKTLLDGSDLLSGGGYNAFWVDPGKHVALVKGEPRSSWIVEPANGRIPRKGAAAPAARPAPAAAPAPTGARTSGRCDRAGAGRS